MKIDRPGSPCFHCNSTDHDTAGHNAMIDVQRYDIEMAFEGDYNPSWQPVPSATGEWVKWDDVKDLLTNAARYQYLRSELGQSMAREDCATDEEYDDYVDAQRNLR